MLDFKTRFKEISKTRGNFCLGIDPSDTILNSWGLPVSTEGLKKFCDIILEASDSMLSMAKFQAAYFERFGPEGLHVLNSCSKEYKSRNTLVLFDGKRGDIGSTNLGYAKAYFGENSYYNFDAITVNAYLGFDALLPLLDFATENGAGVFVVVKSSNPEGEELQSAKIGNETVAEYLAKKISLYNESHNASIGAVLGATNDDMGNIISNLNNSNSQIKLTKNSGDEGSFKSENWYNTISQIKSDESFKDEGEDAYENVRDRDRDQKKDEGSFKSGNWYGALILAPGVGFQGASIESAKKIFGASFANVIITASRSILASGPDIYSIKKQIKLSIDECFI